MGVHMFRSTDRGAPVMTGQQGKMNALLMKCLVEGYPQYAQGATAADASLGDHTTVQLHLPAHPFIIGQEVTVTGLDAEFNGNVIVTNANTDYIWYTKTGTAATSSVNTAIVGGEASVGTATSVTRSGTTVTVAKAGHGFVAGNRVRLVGANQPEYNGWHTVATVPDSGTFTFEISSAYTPATPATGTILLRYGSCALGWTRAFTGTNKSIFQQGASGTKVKGVLICDETDASAHAYGAGLSLAEGATSLSAYTNYPYTAESQITTGMLKSGTADAVARKWVVVGDSRTIIILTQPATAGVANTQGWMVSYFGDFISYLPADNYPLLSGPSVRYTSYAFHSPSSIVQYSVSGTTAFAMYYNYAYATGSQDSQYPARIIRNHLNATGPIQAFFLDAAAYLSLSANGASTLPFGSRNSGYDYGVYPDPVHGGFNMDKLYVQHAASAPNSGNPVTRGELRGLWNPGHRRAQVSTWLNNDTFLGTGELSGKEFEVFDLHGDTSGWFIVETSDTWGA